MTDGATRLCELVKAHQKDDSGTPYSIYGDFPEENLCWTHNNVALDPTDLYDHYTSRDPAKFWTSGQWMTEKPGGSDVGNTETIAKPVPDDKLMYTLHGIKVRAVR